LFLCFPPQDRNQCSPPFPRPNLDSFWWGTSRGISFARCVFVFLLVLWRLMLTRLVDFPSLSEFLFRLFLHSPSFVPPPLGFCFFTTHPQSFFVFTCAFTQHCTLFLFQLQNSIPFPPKGEQTWLVLHPQPPTPHPHPPFLCVFFFSGQTQGGVSFVFISFFFVPLSEKRPDL